MNCDMLARDAAQAPACRSALEKFRSRGIALLRSSEMDALRLAHGART
jgi:hypothetical protein